jgi:hypothetical protein
MAKNSVEDTQKEKLAHTNRSSSENLIECYSCGRQAADIVLIKPPGERSFYIVCQECSKSGVWIRKFKGLNRIEKVDDFVQYLLKRIIYRVSKNELPLDDIEREVTRSIRAFRAIAPFTMSPEVEQEIETAMFLKQLQLFPGTFGALKPDELRRLKEFRTKSLEELANELASYFEESKNWPLLLDRSMFGPRNSVIENFWLEKYPEVKKTDYGYWKCREVKERTLNEKLSAVEEKVYNIILHDFLIWAEQRGEKSEISLDEEAKFLQDNGLKYTPQRFKTELLRDANFRLKQLEPRP